LHVLSTPPAFVLSQNQTLRECFMTSRRGGAVDTEMITEVIVDV
jgi:hypothetical protein